jgi:hypothetical protein
LNIRQSYLYFFSSAAFAVVLRILLLSFAIDSESGFIKSEYALMAGIMLAVIIALALLCFIFGHITKATVKSSLPKSVAFKVISLLLGAVILYDSIFSTMDYALSPWQKSLEFIAAIIASVALISYIVMDAMKIEYPRYITIAPIIFWLLRLVIVFTSFSSLANIVDNIFELSALCLILLSSLQISKMICIETEEKKQTKNFALLLTTSFVCFATSLPRAIVSISGYADMLHRNNLPIMTTLLAGCYFTAYVISCYKSEDK